MKKIDPVFIGAILALIFISVTGAQLIDSDSVVYYKERRNMWKLTSTLLLVMLIILAYCVYKIRKKND